MTELNMTEEEREEMLSVARERLAAKRAREAAELERERLAAEAAGRESARLAAWSALREEHAVLEADLEAQAQAIRIAISAIAESHKRIGHIAKKGMYLHERARALGESLPARTSHSGDVVIATLQKAVPREVEAVHVLGVLSSVGARNW